MLINFLYKISDRGRPKPKLDVATKLNCLDNFISEFQTNIHVLADNCDESTIEEIRKRGIEPIQLSLGNALNMRYAIQFAIDNFPKDSFVYIVEDDYLHLPGSLKALKEGLQIADYVSLYDNPDKYVEGINPYVKDGGEHCKVMISPNFHWKTTNSVTMTFATSVRILQEDKDIWWSYTETKIPHSFYAFRILTRQKYLFSTQSAAKYWRSLKNYITFLSIKSKSKFRRTLITPVPGLSTHAENAWLTPLTNWHTIKSWEDIELVKKQ